ncbi:hypothetical protein RSAG8_06723, partial [Rhizoctonia solani AG-8 WAC10335]
MRVNLDLCACIGASCKSGLSPGLHFKRLWDPVHQLYPWMIDDLIYIGQFKEELPRAAGCGYCSNKLKGRLILLQLNSANSQVEVRSEEHATSSTAQSASNEYIVLARVHKRAKPNEHFTNKLDTKRYAKVGEKWSDGPAIHQHATFT